jgi:hypothetical protein
MQITARAHTTSRYFLRYGIKHFTAAVTMPEKNNTTLSLPDKLPGLGKVTVTFIIDFLRISYSK